MSDAIGNLSDVIYEHRVRAGITQRELAERARVSRHTIVNLEAATMSGVRFETVCKVLAALGLEMRYMPRCVPSQPATPEGAEARERFRRRFQVGGGDYALLTPRS